MLKNGQTYFENLVLFTTQDFKSIFGHFSTLWNKGLKLKDTKDKLGSKLSSLEWLEQSKKSKCVIKYWYLIVTL